MKPLKFITNFPVFVIIFLVLSACGGDGGGSSGTSTPPQAINLPPSFSANSVDVATNENASGAIYTATASDPDSPASSLIYSLTGVDSSLFQIDGTSGALSFISAPDYETPTDNGADNIYNITIEVTDGTNNASQVVIISVTNLDEAAPSVTAPEMKIANAGENLEIVAEASDDVSIETIVWSQVTGDPLAVTGSNTETLQLTVPELDEGVTVSFKVVVSDSLGQTAEAFTEVIINPITLNASRVNVGISTTPGIDMTDEDAPLLIVVDNKVMAADPTSPIGVDVPQDGGRVIALTSANGNPLLMSYQGASANDITLSVESSADAFVMRSPRFFGVEVTNFSALSSRIRTHSRYPDLISIIEERLLTSPCPMSQACNVRGARVAEQIAQDITIDDLVALGE